MLNKDCKMFGGGYCLCSACQSMRKTLEELTSLEADDIMKTDEAKKVYEEMKKALEDLESSSQV